MASMTIEQAQEKGVVVGLQPYSDVQSRREVDDLVVNEPDVFNLFLLALESLQGKENKMSYPEIAGIHGLPNREWDNVQPDKDILTQLIRNSGGYCAHASDLFPTWHRPYMAMMEQTIYDTMVRIASQFDDGKYRLAAQKFRLPYWDYLHPREQKDTTFPGIFTDRETSFPYDFRLPRVLNEERLMVYRPKNQEPYDEAELVPMNNPLKTFWFPKDGGLDQETWGTHTVRYPLTGEKARLQALDNALNKKRASAVHELLEWTNAPAYKNYRNFAKTATEDGGSAGSLEDFHNKYHGDIGGSGGHMDDPRVAAFDPVFWLHHCNIDRLLAVWQTQNKEWVVERTAKPNALTNLYPFRKTTETFWNSVDSRDVEAFGYTYSELQGKADPASVKKRFEAKYRWSVEPKNWSRGKPKAEDFEPPAEMQPVDVDGAQVFHTLPSKSATESYAVKMAAPRRMEMEQQVFSAFSNGRHGTNDHNSGRSARSPMDVPSFKHDGKVWKDEPDHRLRLQWYIDIEVNRNALNGPFTIFHFVGPVNQLNESSTCWRTEPIFAGANHIFTAPVEDCDNCARQSEEGLKVTGTNAITPILLDYIKAEKLPSLSPDDVVPFLKKNMIWRVGNADQTADPARVSGLKVGVSATLSTISSRSTVPEFQEPLFFPGLTDDHRSGNPTAQ